MSRKRPVSIAGRCGRRSGAVEVLVLQRAEESLDDAGSQGRNCWRGVCERGNYIREMPGRRIRLIDCGYHTGPLKIIITTPTGHHHLSRAPDPP